MYMKSIRSEVNDVLRLSLMNKRLNTKKLVEC